MRKWLAVICSTLALALANGCQKKSCADYSTCKTSDYPTLKDGSIQRLDPRLDALLAPDAKIEMLAEGFKWAEGPLWLPDQKKLIFSDVPANTIYQWKEGQHTASVYMKPSGYTGFAERGGEPGSNGLTLDRSGRLILCEHGDRRIARRELNGKKTTLANKYDGKRFSSPNDVVVKSNGDVYFTDPPYGLPLNWKDPTRELDWCGVYRIHEPAIMTKWSAQITLLTKELTRPNGLCFSPDESKLYVAVSDPEKAIYMEYPVKADGTLGNGKIFKDVTALAKSGLKGLPDGIKTDAKGNLWATGPGGVLIFSPDGTHLGTILTNQPTANCNWGDDGSTLYITVNHCICRVRTKVLGAGWKNGITN